MPSTSMAYPAATVDALVAMRGDVRYSFTEKCASPTMFVVSSRVTRPPQISSMSSGWLSRVDLSILVSVLLMAIASVNSARVRGRTEHTSHLRTREARAKSSGGILLRIRS